MAKTTKTTQRMDHPRFDRKVFRVHPKKLDSLAGLLRRQPEAIRLALKALVGKKPVAEISGDRILQYMEKHREEFGTSHEDIHRLFSIESCLFKRAGAIEDLGTVA